MSRFILFSVAVALLSLPIAATADDKQSMVYGLGMSSCGSLVQAFRQDSPNAVLNYQGRQFPTIAHTYQQWLGGFVSSYNLYTSQTGKLGHGTDIHGLMEWVHAYCKKNTTSTVTQAAVEMVHSLERKQ